MGQSGSSQQHRLKRRALWAALWLAKLIRFMPDVLRLPPSVQAYLERRLDLLAGFVVHLVIIRAGAQFRPRGRQRNRFASVRAAARPDVRSRCTLSLRATIGGQLRRELKAGGLKSRAEAILRALQDIDRLASRFLRRMRKGLSRRLSAHTRVLDALLHHRPAGGIPPQISLGEDLRAARAPP